MISINIFVAPREKPLLNNTIKSLRKAGFDQKINISAEPGTKIEIEDKNVLIYNNPEKYGIAISWRETIKRFLDTTNDPWFMFLDDDVECVENTAKHINKFCSSIKENIGFVSGYTPMAYSETWPWLNQFNGWAELNRGWNTWGTQCVLLQRQSAKLLNLSEKMKNLPRNFHHVDAIFGEFFEKCQLDCYYSVPSLFEHVGLWDSTTHNHAHPMNRGLRYGEKFSSDVVKKENSKSILHV